MKKLLSLMLAIAVMLTASSCSFVVNTNEAAQLDYPVTIGNRVFDKTPENVVVLSDNIADIILACGYEGMLSGRSDSCNQDGLKLLPSVGTPDEPSVDKLKELDAKLVISDNGFDRETLEKIESVGAEVLIMKPAANNRELTKLYGNVAALFAGNYTGRMRAISTADKLQSSLDSMKSDIPDSNLVSTVCYIYDVVDDMCITAYGGDYSSQLFDYARLTNIAAESDNKYLSIDTVVMSNPSYIFCDNAAAAKIAESSKLSNLDAVKNGRMFIMPKSYMTLQGNTRLLAVDFLAAKTCGEYTPREAWPDDFVSEELTQEYVPPFEPRENIFYTVGESYNQIEDIELRLIELGYLNDVEADKNFDENTAGAVAAFQAQNGIEITGIADYNTLVVLLSAEAIPANS